jgi:thymidylate synthase
MIAHVCGLEVGEFIHTLGDMHIYANHVNQVHEQLTRTPYLDENDNYYSKLYLNPEIKDIDDFKFEDIIVKYDHFHPAIYGAVSV